MSVDIIAFALDLANEFVENPDNSTVVGVEFPIKTVPDEARLYMFLVQLSDTPTRFIDDSLGQLSIAPSSMNELDISMVKSVRFKQSTIDFVFIVFIPEIERLVTDKLFNELHSSED